MPPELGLHPHHNKDFARAVIRAYVFGKKNFRFIKNNYHTSEYIENVREDILNKFYKIKVIY